MPIGVRIIAASSREDLAHHATSALQQAGGAVAQRPSIEP
jgi:hypothetical protein